MDANHFVDWRDENFALIDLCDAFGAGDSIQNFLHLACAGHFVGIILGAPDPVSPPAQGGRRPKKLFVITGTGDYSHLVAEDILLQSGRGITKVRGNISIL